MSIGDLQKLILYTKDNHFIEKLNENILNFHSIFYEESTQKV